MVAILHPTTGRVIACAIEVHRALGPGLLESVYEQCLAVELASAGIAFERQVPVPLTYRGREIVGLRVDLLVEGNLIVEIKSVDRLHPVHTAQAITYLKLTGARQALLMNFNVIRLTDGLKSLLPPREPHTPGDVIRFGEEN